MATFYEGELEETEQAADAKRCSKLASRRHAERMLRLGDVLRDRARRLRRGRRSFYSRAFSSANRRAPPHWAGLGRESRRSAVRTKSADRAARREALEIQPDCGLRSTTSLGHGAIEILGDRDEGHGKFSSKNKHGRVRPSSDPARCRSVVRSPISARRLASRPVAMP